MPAQTTQATASQIPATTTSPVTSTVGPSVRQPAGNAAAVERAGLAGAPIAGDLRGWDELIAAATGFLGLDDGETENVFRLAEQTAGNLQAAHGKLGEMAEKARLLELDEVAARLDGAAAKLSKTAGLAEQLTTAMGVGNDLALLKRLAKASAAVAKVKMDAPEAAAVFDEWFAAMGQTGELLASKGGPWGAVFAPFATFVRMLGESNFFARVQMNLAAQGTGRANWGTVNELAEEGF